MKSCTIFAGGEPVSRDAVDFSAVGKSLVICADRGYILAQNLGICPDIVIGDFDSMDISLQNTEKITVKTYPPEKDDTDLMLAVKEGFQENCDDFTIYGALGGRFDHTFGGIQSLAYIVNHRGKGRIISDTENIEMFSKGKYQIKKEEDRYFSLFAFSQKVENLTIKGAKYTVQNYTLEYDFPLGVSNEITEDFAEISFKSGLLLAILSQKN